MEPSATPSSPALGPSLAGPGDHVRLDTTLRRFADLHQALLAGSSDMDPAVVLSELRVDLELHFALEEADTFFGAVLRERPSLSHGVLKLRHQHAALLGTLEELRGFAANQEQWRDLALAAPQFLDAFRAHEHEETALLQDFFLRDDGVGAD